MRSASSARWRICVTQHSPKSEQEAPMQFSLEAEISRQKSTLSGRSSISPAIAGLGARGPGLDGAEHRQLVEAAEAPRLREGAEAHQAEVVSASLHDRDAQVAPEGAGEDRDVLPEELLLQVARAGGDDHAPPQLHRGQQVGQGLPRSGAGLREERPPVGQHPRPPRRRAAPGPAAPRSRAGRGRADRAAQRSVDDGSGGEAHHATGDVTAEAGPRRPRSELGGLRHAGGLEHRVHLAPRDGQEALHHVGVEVGAAVLDQPAQASSQGRPSL